MEQLKKPLLNKKKRTITYYIQKGWNSKKIVVTFKSLKLIPKTLFDTEQVLIYCLKQEILTHNNKDLIRGKELINNIKLFQIFKLIKKDEIKTIGKLLKFLNEDKD